MNILEKLPLNDSNHFLAFGVVQKILRSDPVLNRVVKTWRAWDGDPKDIQPPASGDLPLIRLTPKPSPADWWNEQTHSMPLNIFIECGVMGTSFRNASNLFFAVVAALFPSDSSLRQSNSQLLIAAGVQGGVVTVSQPAYDANFGKTQEPLTWSTGVIKLNVVVKT